MTDAVRRILIVDPDIEVGQLYQAALRQKGYTAIATDKAKLAAELARTLVPDIILLDPNFTGDERKQLLDDLLSAPETAQSAIILTGERSIHPQLKELYHQKFDHFDKNQHVDQLLKRINTYFESVAPLEAEGRAISMPETEPIKAAQPESPHISTTVRQEAQLKTKPHIAIVADDPFIVRLYETKLSQANFTVSIAPDPGSAQAWLLEQHPDVLVLSQKFGIELIEQYKQSDSRPLIVDVLPEGQVCPKAIGEMNGVCLPKESLTPAALVEEIKRLLSRGSAE